MFYIHNVPGRLRIISEAVKKNPSAPDAIRMGLSTLTGIGVVYVNLTTGSILIHYNPQTANVRDIVGVIERKGYFDRSKAISSDDYFRNGFSKIGKTAVNTMALTFIGNVVANTPLSFLRFLL